MGQAYQCWWGIYRKINVFSRFEYVLYPFLTYLLPLPRNNRFFMCSKLSSLLLMYRMPCSLIQCVRTHDRLYHNTEIIVRITDRPTANFGAEYFELFGRLKVLTPDFTSAQPAGWTMARIQPQAIHGAFAVGDMRALFSQSTFPCQL
jgi:hypothetical protein